MEQLTIRKPDDRKTGHEPEIENEGKAWKRQI